MSRSAKEGRKDPGRLPSLTPRSGTHSYFIRYLPRYLGLFYSSFERSNRYFIYFLMRQKIYKEKLPSAALDRIDERLIPTIS